MLWAACSDRKLRSGGIGCWVYVCVLSLHVCVLRVDDSRKYYWHQAGGNDKGTLIWCQHQTTRKKNRWSKRVDQLKKKQGSKNHHATVHGRLQYSIHTRKNFVFLYPTGGATKEVLYAALWLCSTFRLESTFSHHANMLMFECWATS